MPAYSPIERLDRLRSLLTSRKHTLDELAETLEVSESTVRRLLAALERVNEPLVEDVGDDGRKRWSLLAPSREHTVRMTSAQLVALVVARNAARAILKGTGFDDDLATVCARLTDQLKGKDAELVKDLDRKFYDRGEKAWELAEKADTLDDLTSALLRNERVMLRRMASDGVERMHLFDPYTLVTHNKGLYLVGFSHDRAQRISLGIDLIREASRRRGETFKCPDDYKPAEMFKDTVGMFTGPPVHVVLHVERPQVRFITRAPFHPSQKTVKVYENGSIDISLDVAQNAEFDKLILSYCDHSVVLSPPVLRRRIAAILKKAADRYVD